MMTTRKKRRPTSADQGSRCTHCGTPRDVAPLRDWQQLNMMHPLPGMYSLFHDIEMELGPDVMLVLCLGCGCVQPAGYLRSHARGHAA